MFGLGPLRPDLASRVAVVARHAAAMNLETYLIGGTVRDLLLRRDSPDLDFVVVGDAPALAAAVAGELGGSVVRHAAFGTAEVVAGDVQLDFVTARSETYPRPAALPEIRSGSLDDDLRRRDFTVNTLAVSLDAPETLIDRHDGRADLDAKALRILHPKSFEDDPTRVFRAVRFEARLGFRMEPHTETLARRAAAEGAFAPLSGSRLRHELELLMECAEGGESLALAGLERLDELGVLTAIHPGLRLDDELRGLLRRAVAVHAWYVSVGASGPPARLGLLLLLALASTVDGGELARRLLLAGQEERLLIEGAARVRAAGAALAAARAAHEVDEILAPLAGEELLLVAVEERAWTWVRRYLLEMRPLTLAIRGADLLAAGAPRGPQVGSALRATRAARLDGLISADEELEFALVELKRRVD